MKDLLETYEKVTIRQIEQPGREFDQFFQQLREPFFANSGSHAKPEFRELISLKEKCYQINVLVKEARISSYSS